MSILETLPSTAYTIDRCMCVCHSLSWVICGLGIRDLLSCQPSLTTTNLLTTNLPNHLTLQPTHQSNQSSYSYT